MCSSGLMNAQSSADDLIQMAELALKLRSMVFDVTSADINGKERTIPIKFRFGLHCGEVVAGVISKTRL